MQGDEDLNCRFFSRPTPSKIQMASILKCQNDRDTEIKNSFIEQNRREKQNENKKTLNAKIQLKILKKKMFKKLPTKLSTH